VWLQLCSLPFYREVAKSMELETSRGTLFTGEARLGRDSQRADWSSCLGWVVNFVGGRESVG
jgi:hypothetical protein